MFVTARAEYACLAMIELATRYAEKKPVRLVDVTEKHGIPRRFVVLILLQMKAAGLVQTVRGPSGGYTLAKAAGEYHTQRYLSSPRTGRTTYRTGW